jgi:hypothetical protein
LQLGQVVDYVARRQLASHRVTCEICRERGSFTRIDASSRNLPATCDRAAGRSEIVRSKSQWTAHLRPLSMRFPGKDNQPDEAEACL